MALLVAPPRLHRLSTATRCGGSGSALSSQSQPRRKERLSVELTPTVQVGMPPPRLGSAVAMPQQLWLLVVENIGRIRSRIFHPRCPLGGLPEPEIVFSDNKLPTVLCLALSLCVGMPLSDSRFAAAGILEAPQLSVGIVKDSGAGLLIPRTSDGHGYDFSSLRAAPVLAVTSGGGVCECEETYGILPCSTTVGGNLFLMGVYGYLLLTAAKFISEGSELLLEVMNPGLLGGLLLPVLGALPDSLLISFSGAGGTVEEAQQEVMVGVGVLAGSTVMLLTIAWASSLYAGRCDLSGPEGTAEDLKLSRKFDLYGTGVTTDEQTRWGAWIMIASVVPYLCAQIPLLDGQPAQGSVAALAGAALALAGLVAYATYQVASPWLQQKRIEEARLQFLRSRALQGVTSFTTKTSPLLKTSSESEQRSSGHEFLRELFVAFDKNKDGRMEVEELKGLIIGLDIEEEGSIPAEQQVETWLTEFDINADGTLSENEFVYGLSKWAQEVTRAKRSRQFRQDVESMHSSFWAAQSEEAKKVLDLLESEVNGVETADADAKPADASAIVRKAAIYMGAGAALAAVFADPMVDTISSFSTASGVPAFFVAFVVTPFASNASELVSSILFAMKKRKRNISLTFSQLYGAVTINNTLCLGLFLGIVYARGLTWDFSSEVTVIVFTILVSGVVGGSRTTFPLWSAVPILALYPFSIAAVALLDSALGWK